MRQDNAEAKRILKKQYVPTEPPLTINWTIYEASESEQAWQHYRSLTDGQFVGLVSKDAPTVYLVGEQTVQRSFFDLLGAVQS